MYEVVRFLDFKDNFHNFAKDISKHIKLKSHVWGFTLWNASDVPSLPIHALTCIVDNDKLLIEYASDLINGTNKAIKPKKFESLTNVILIQGIKESIDRDLGLSTTKLDWASIGTSATAEAEAQTDLQAEFTDTAYARKVFSTAGSSSRVNQTMKLGMLWDDSSFDSTPVTIREAGIHWHLSDSLKCHARVVSTDFILDAGDLFVSQINELEENGTL